MGLWVFVYKYMYACICVYVWMCIHVYVCMCICIYVHVYMCLCAKTAKEEMKFSFVSLSFCFFPHYVPACVTCFCHHLCLLSPVSDPCSAGLPLSGSFSPFPLVPLSPSTQSLCWHRSTRYLGNHCRVITCDWSG